MSRNARKVVVIGAGLGGMSAAISLAAEGYSVEIHEKNNKIGGKLNILKDSGFSFDLGPSILTLPHIFEVLFQKAGTTFTDNVTIRPIEPQWRTFFEDGSIFNLYYDHEKMRDEIRRFDAACENGFFDFLSYSGKQYDIIERGYFNQGLDTVRDFMRFYPPSDVVHFDLLRTMHQGVAHYIKNPAICDVMDFFIKYVGSSAYSAPGFMNLMPTIQFRYKLWYVDGGMYHIARAMETVMKSLGIEVHLNSEVTAILTDNGHVTGIRTHSGNHVKADYVVSNMETIPAYEKLLGEPRSFLRRYKRFEPACSGLILDLGVRRKYSQLAHHNFFLSSNQREHFDTVFKKKKLPDDPTIYLVAASRTDPTVAPEGCEALKILPHIPYISETNMYSITDYRNFKERILDKLERMGLEDLRENIVFEHMWTPDDIQRQYYSNKGSIYGVVCDRFKNYALKTPKQSPKYPNLFFVGGSVNPGAGMPMVTLCGMKVAERIVRADTGGTA